MHAAPPKILAILETLAEGFAKVGVPCEIVDTTPKYGNPDTFLYIGRAGQEDKLWLAPHCLTARSLEYGDSVKSYDNILAMAQQFYPHGFILMGMSYHYRGTKLRFNYGTHIKIEYERKYSEGVYRCFVKNASGGYGKPVEHKDIVKALEFAQEAKDVPKAKVVREEVELGEPHDFVEVPLFTLARNRKDTFVVNTGQVQEISVVGVVSIGSNRDLIDAANPNFDAWFNCRCVNVDESRAPSTIPFNIVTNGEGWYLVEKNGKRYRAVPHRDRTGQYKVALTSIDYDLINHAIRQYANREGPQ